MSSRRLVPFTFIFALFAPTSGFAQVTNQPTPAPMVTAESERWYQNGEPIAYSGNIYYPVGAQIHFNANEMVRSGFVMGVPLYTRTTFEPYSIVFVPLAGGMMQPYERRRVGDIAGTTGSTPPSLPTSSNPSDSPAIIPQAGGAPTGASGVPPEPQAVTVAGSPTQTAPRVMDANPVAAPGRTAAVSARPSPKRLPSRTSIGPKPEGVNAVFVDFRGRRWYPDGAAVLFDRSKMLQIGERSGFPVFADREAPESRIYIPVAIGGTMVVAYSLRRPQ